MKVINKVSELNKLLESGKPLLLDFYADWCGPCQALMPIVEGLADKYEDDFVIAKVNVDHNQDIAREFNVRSIPALFFIQDREIKERLTGLQSKEGLEHKINSYRD